METYNESSERMKLNKEYFFDFLLNKSHDKKRSPHCHPQF
jgi:hypothetical protein